MREDKKILAGLVKHFLEQDDPLTPLIEEYFLKREQPRYMKKRLPQITLDLLPRDRNPGRLSPSSICGCERQSAFTFLGVEGKTTRDHETEMIFDDGNWRHHRWQTIFKDMARMFPERFKVISIEDPSRIDSIKVAGHLDCLFEIFWNGEWVRCVVDYKGANSFAYDHVFRNHTPKAEHVKQLRAYMKAKRVRVGFVLYDDKNSNRINVFVVRTTKGQWREVREWCERVLYQLDRHILPPRHPDCNNGHYLYGKCRFKGYCFGDAAEDTLAVEKQVYEGFEGVDEKWNEFLLELEDES